MGQRARKPTRVTSSNNSRKRSGGRAAAGGVGYEAKIGAFLAVQMLAGEAGRAWDWNGDEMECVTMQSADSVDDVVVTHRKSSRGQAFVQAKDWNRSIGISTASKVFNEVIQAFARQFFATPASTRDSVRLIWAVPSTVGSRLTHDLLKLLDAHRQHAEDAPLTLFRGNRMRAERTVLRPLEIVAANAYAVAFSRKPTEGELRGFLRAMFIEVHDFDQGNSDPRIARQLIAQYIADAPTDAPKIWEKLTTLFADANVRGITQTAASLRRELTSASFPLRAAPEFSPDVQFLRELTNQNLRRLQDHSILKFSRKAAIHIDRTHDLSPLVAAINSGHLLLTGEPGCGKSGLLHDVATSLANNGSPVVVLLAEELFDRSAASVPTGVPGLRHHLDRVLAAWPSGARGVLITDALDSVRDQELSKVLRQLHTSIIAGTSGWTVVASVREFDLRCGRELREQFPGVGVAGHAHADFANVAHFHLVGLRDTEVEWLAQQQPSLRPFLDSANRNAKSAGLQRSPFYLRLAAELLGSGVPPVRLADWNSPALLLRSFWSRRVEEQADAEERQATIRKICAGMVSIRKPVLSAKELNLSSDERRTLRELRSGGILLGPAMRYGNLVGEEALRFSHHLLHDYAIARTLIPTLPDRLCDFVSTNPLIPIFYRQSFIFALEEIWDLDPTREAYWKTTIDLEAVPGLHGVSRIAGPILAARRIESINDLTPLLRLVQSAGDFQDSAPGKTLRHLGAGLQDADADALRSGSGAWCAFAQQLSLLLDSLSYIETPLVHVIARLDNIGVTQNDEERRALNFAARALLRIYLKKPVNKGWAYCALVAIEAICRTFSSAPAESEAILLEMMAPARMAEFPHDELFRLAHKLEHVGPTGSRVVERAFAYAFGSQPEYGKWQQFGTAILPMNMQLSDHWNGVRYALAAFYEKGKNLSPALAASLMCIAANAAARGEGRGFGRRAVDVIGAISFRGCGCELIEDFSHVWGRGDHPSDHEAARIVRSFSNSLKSWADNGDGAAIDEALDVLAARAGTAWLWSVVMEVGADSPTTLGVKLMPFAQSPLVLVHMDYCYAATRLFGALHHTGDSKTRERFEQIVMQLTSLASADESARPMYRREILEHAQNRLLGALVESEIFLPEAAALLRSRREADVLVENRRREAPRGGFVKMEPEDRLAAEGITLKDQSDRNLFQLRERLKKAFPDDRKQLRAVHAERSWKLLLECERATRKQPEENNSMTQELWGHLVIASSNLVHCADWPATSKRWAFIRGILLRAARDPVPRKDDSEVDPNTSWPAWGVPAPRVDAARGLPMLAYRLGRVDRPMESALVQLSRDLSLPVRFNYADHLTALWKPAPVLLWRIIDSIIEHERFFCVLDPLTSSVDWLVHQSREAALVRLAGIAKRAEGAAPKNHIHERLAASYLFDYLRTGDVRSEAHILALMEKCDTELGHDAIAPLLHECRVGGWLTGGSPEPADKKAEERRARTWSFLRRLLAKAQEKWRSRQKQWKEQGPFEGEAFKEYHAATKPAMQMIDDVAMQLYFASGAYDEKRTGNQVEEKLDTARTKRFWLEAQPLFGELVKEWHPHTIYHVVQTLEHLMPYDPRLVFMLATNAIRSSAEVGFQHEHLAVGEVVKLIQRALADHREIFQTSGQERSECLDALLLVLDIFVEAGWPEARQITYRLEEIYR